MGGSSKKVTVGYRYYLTMHGVLSLGPVDYITEVLADGKSAWKGRITDGAIQINAPNLFGGDSREGGVSGQIDVMTGEPDQGVNPYLQRIIGGLVPAFRGITSVVFRDFYFGINPYLKKIAFRVSRIMTKTDYTPQWYPMRARIGGGVVPLKPDSNLYIALDFSESMAVEMPGSGGKTRFHVMLEALRIVFDHLIELTKQGIFVNIRLIFWAHMLTSRSWEQATEANIEDLWDFAQRQTPSGIATMATRAFEGAPGWFSRTTPRNNVCVCVSDGEMIEIQEALDWYVGVMMDRETPPYSVSEGTAVAMRGVGIATRGSLQYFDNSGRNVPVVTSGTPERLAEVILDALYQRDEFLETGDIDPIHIIRETLTSQEWGLGVADSGEEIDNTAFMKAADVLYDENMGMSLKWDKQGPVGEFIDIILRHIDAALYIDRFTGKYTIKLIRDDYDENNLILLNEYNVEKVADFSRPAFGELTNSVTVNYTNPADNSQASTTAQDIALVHMQGREINTTVQYPGFTNAEIATRVAQRDLTTLSTPLVKCTIYANSDASNLFIGDVFKFSWKDYDVENVVMRITSIAYGDGKTNRVRITATQDVFSLPEKLIIETPPSEWVNPVQPPVPVLERILYELPYLELVQQSGQTVVDNQISANPEIGFVGAAALRPHASAINARFMTDDGGGFVDAGAVDFCPGAVVDGEVGHMTTDIPIVDLVQMDGVSIGDWCQIGTELMAVVALTDSQLTIKRGCLDTVPIPHAIGSVVYFWDAYGQGSPTEYVESDTIDVKLLTVTGIGVLDMDDAPVDSLAIRGRAARPYPPAQVRINGQYFPTDQQTSLNVSWVHRNRLQQTGAILLGFEDGGVTPEDGVTYRLEVAPGEFAAPVFTLSDIDATSATLPLTGLPGGAAHAYVRLFAVRDGLDSYQFHNIRVNLPHGDGGHVLFEMNEFTPPPAGNNIVFEMEA